MREDRTAQWRGPGRIRCRTSRVHPEVRAGRLRLHYSAAMQAPTPDITAWIADWQQGDAHARDRVFTHLYPELRRLAGAVLRSNADHHTLEATALLNDALMKLIQARPPAAEDRVHFARIVARAMRQILIDRARRRLADKRGGGERALAIEDFDAVELGSPAELVALDDALKRLAEFDARAATVVELRVFVGLTIDETAQAMELHAATVNREWAHATAWLKQHVFARD
jgi:RNA polymerase sigma factor (TIGR02999 family)